MFKKLQIILISVAASFLVVSCNSSSPDVNAETEAEIPLGPGPSGENALTVVVLVIDSLMPEDIDASGMPNLTQLVAAGAIFKESRSVFSAETIPNHIAMMTGLYPDRNAIPTNNFWDRDSNGEKDGEDLDNPNELEAKTMFTWIDEKCRQGATPVNVGLKTAAVMSKTYLYEVFRGDANDGSNNDSGISELNVEPDTNWEPSTSPGYIGPGSEHTPDNFTGPEAIATLPNADFIFINLGDLDRSSHAAGPGVRAGARTTADQQIGNIVQHLVDSDRWGNTVFLVVSDHGMDFSTVNPEPPTASSADAAAAASCIALADDRTPQCSGNVIANVANNSISTQPVLDDLATDACGFEEMTAVQNGGTNSIAVTSGAATTSAEAQKSLLAARACLMDHGGTDDNVPDCTTVLTTYAANALTCSVRKAALADDILYGWYANPSLYNGNALTGVLGTDEHASSIMPDTIKSRHENLGDLVLVTADARKFSETDASGNPIPGNHGHMETIHNTVIVSGGVDFLAQAQEIIDFDNTTGLEPHFMRDPRQSENIDVAPTVAWLLGLINIDANGKMLDGTAPAISGVPAIKFADFPDNGDTYPDYGDSVTRQGFDGRVLIEAFNISHDMPPSGCAIIPDA